MKGQKHLLSNHADIDPTINNAIEHFLFEESSREEHKICSNLVRRGQDVFAILPSFIFLLFSTLFYSTNNKRNQRKSWEVNSDDHHRCASCRHNKTNLKRCRITASTAIGWGQEEGMDEDSAM